MIQQPLGIASFHTEHGPEIQVQLLDYGISEGQLLFFDIFQASYVAEGNDTLNRGEGIGGIDGGRRSSVLSIVSSMWQACWNVSDRWKVGKLECMECGWQATHIRAVKSRGLTRTSWKGTSTSTILSTCAICCIAFAFTSGGQSQYSDQGPLNGKTPVTEIIIIDGQHHICR